MEREGGCRIGVARDSGIDEVILENDLLKVTVLAGKGGDIHAIVYKPLAVEILLKTAEGLRPFAGRDLRTNRLTWHSEIFAGGWMDVLPHRAVYRDIEVAQETSGIAATLPWNHEVAEDSPRRAAVRLSVRLPVVPLFAEKVISLVAGSAALDVSESVRNVGASPVSFTWTQHPTFGGELLDESAEVSLPRCTVFRPRDYASARDRGLGPFERGIDSFVVPGGGWTLRSVGPRHERGELFVTMKDLDRPEAAIVNRGKNVGAALSWDGAAFPYLRYWYRSSPEIYTVGLEPSNDYFADLRDSLRHGTCLSLGPGESRSAWIRCSVFQVSP